MNKSPFFSVIVPTYNQAQYLGEALDSLLQQTNTDWEAVVVNDGSTDSTPEIVERYCRKDARFRSIHKENGGVASALNAGLREAKGQWICWLSSDDLFDNHKLEIHRDWIKKNPECRFFFSHFKELDQETGKLNDPPLWRSIPDPKWQVLEMLQCTYVHGNSICVQKIAWLHVGLFDEELRYGQDYDMWLRLLANFPAVFIPERTCITRCHAQQGSKGFMEACFYDSAKAAIKFLNQYNFPQLFPLIDLNDAKIAHQAIIKALDILGDPGGFLYALGPHPLLLLRIIEWTWSKDEAFGSSLQEAIRSRTRALCLQYNGTAFGFFWKALAVATQLPHGSFEYQQVLPAMVAEANYWRLKSTDADKAASLHRFLELFEDRLLPREVPPPQGNSKEIVFVCQLGSNLTDGVKYGTFRATLEIAKYLMRAGRMVLLTGLSSRRIGFIEGVLFVGAEEEPMLARVVSLLAPIDTLIGISRADVLGMARARRVLVCHHGPHIIQGGIPNNVLNKKDIPVICGSQYSKSEQIKYGVKEDIIYVVPNAYDHSIFNTSLNLHRPLHSLIYAGIVAHYKGVDVALKAFDIIRKKFPDATFQIYGKTNSWRDCGSNLLSEYWLDSKGFPLWSRIESDLEKFKYCGEVSPEHLSDAFRSHSLFVMPSRIAETFGIVLLEAQACGCIPVVPNQGGFPETLRNGITGYLYDQNDAEGLAAQVIRLWEQDLPTEAQRLAAKEFAEKTFSWERSGSALLNIIESTNSSANRMEVILIHLLCRWDLVRYKFIKIAGYLYRYILQYRSPFKKW